MMGTGDSLTVKDLRAKLEEGHSVEVAGYTLAPTLAAGLESLELSALGELPPCRVDWLMVGRGDGTPPPAVRRQLAALENASFDPRYRTVAGDQFWSTAETVVVPGLIETTLEETVGAAV